MAWVGVLADGSPVAVILSAGRGRLELAAAWVAAGAESLVLADPATVRAATGFEVGAVPLVGHGLPVVFDRRLLELAQVYGGSGDPLHTLAIAPADLERISAPVGWLS
ncbi:aminoacyl-tRNA deacylase [Cellulomonas denverensis]|uniref:YbaK/EbsC family protein n=1 Tax=Cellulomonas denverensis TaxID=264297 RepID=A0A7X6QYF4_9CELL|nr:YbaK/EbsC family protein [Cellulomonas denverensis]NKY22058.1 YbaK/EbsC family protein [Cellulomonas denverensis]GIG27390.1 hypothetical protein Cde04nite_36340 [Cellulomonas denverensis]